MKLIGCLILTAALTFGQAAPGVQLKAAAHKEEVEGDLKGAMEAYRRIIAASGKERGVAAEAMLRLARCHEKLGQAEARKLYEQIVTSYRDQNAVATQARERLAMLDAPAKVAGTLTARQIWTDPAVDTSGSVSPDGRLAAITDWQTGDLAIRNIATGQINRINLKTSWSDSSDYAIGPVFSPDQRQIAYQWYSTKDDVWEVRTVASEPGAKPRVLLSNAEILWTLIGGWSNDGKSILAAVWHRDRAGQIGWISTRDGSFGALKSLGGRGVEKIALSPDGRHIAYDVRQKQEGPEHDIYVLTSDGLSESVLVEGPADESLPCWTPDGSRVVFLSNRSGRPDLMSIAVFDGRPYGTPEIVKADVGNVQPLSFNRAGSLYYLADRSDEDVYAIDVDRSSGKGRGAAIRLTQSFVGQNRGARWSPDGKFIAFHTLRGTKRQVPGANSLVVKTVATGQEGVFPINFRIGAPPVWFHRDRAILTVGSDSRGKTVLYKLELETGEYKLLQSLNILLRAGVALTPDDKTLYAPTSDDHSKVSRIVRVDLSTGRHTTIYQAPDGSQVSGLSLSPDDRLLAMTLFTRKGEKYQNLVAAVHTDGSGFRPLTEPGDTGGLADILGRAWSPDSRSIYFVRNHGTESQVWRIPATGGAAEKTGIAAKGLWAIDLSADGSRIAFSAGARHNPELWVLENLMPILKVSR
jgi:Tol biopolymer transport system component